MWAWCQALQPPSRAEKSAELPACRLCCPSHWMALVSRTGPHGALSPASPVKLRTVGPSMDQGEGEKESFHLVES